MPNWTCPACTTACAEDAIACPKCGQSATADAPSGSEVLRGVRERNRDSYLYPLGLAVGGVCGVVALGVYALFENNPQPWGPFLMMFAGCGAVFGLVVAQVLSMIRERRPYN